MSKYAAATVAFFGHDTYGRMINLAQRAGDGAWFYRYSRSGGGVSRWIQYDGEVVHPTGYTNAYTGERIAYTSAESAQLVEWGFRTLRAGGPEGIRLPSAKPTGRA